ncbi:MAG: beta-galactosidase [Spirochaetes bacterium]|nr:beta-galactosidase [Spirochaetota bacterium]
MKRGILSGLMIFMGTIVLSAINIAVDIAPASDIGENIIPNSGFELRDGDAPSSWRFNPGKANASFSLITDAHSGGTAVFISNSAPYGPNIFGQIILAKNISLEPGQQYTLSLYLKSANPGNAWAGGCNGWNMRMTLPKTGANWQRVIKTFIAGPNDRDCPIMINTDSPTEGIIIDSVKLEKGPHATTFFDKDSFGGKCAVTLDVPGRLSAVSNEARVSAYLYVPADNTPFTVSLLDENNNVLRSAEKKASSGMNRVAMTLSITDDTPGNNRYRISVAAGGIRKEASFELFSPAQYLALIRRSSLAVEELKSVIDVSDKKGVQAPFARAARAIAGRFLKIAEIKYNAGLIPEAADDVRYIEATCRRESDAQKAVLAGSARAITIPDPALATVTIRNGNFYAGNEPVMLIGGMGYGELLAELDVYRDYGFNILGDDFNSYSALRMMTNDGVCDESVFPRFKASWDKLTGQNVAIAYNPTLHYFPFWAMQKYPDITGGDVVDVLPDWSGLGRHRTKRHKIYGGFFPFAIDSPNLRTLVSDYYRKLAPALCDHPSMHVVWLMNEPTYKSKDTNYVRQFCESLANKYGTIDRLNTVWNTNIAAFEKITPPPSRSPGYSDWLSFHQDQVASWFEWLAAEFKKNCPKALLSNKPMAWTLLSPENGIDFEREALLWDIPGCDAGRKPLTENEFSFGWTEPIMLFDFQRSVAPGKPLADHEYHYIHEPDVSSEYVRATYFHSYFHGLRMSQFWVWSKGDIGIDKGGAGMQHTAWSQPKVTWGTATAALDIRRLAKYVAAFPGTPEVFFYFSKPSLYLNHDAYVKTLTSAYRAGIALDAPVGFITDRMIKNGDLKKCRLLVVAGATHAEKEIIDAVQQYIASGGKAVFIGDCLTQDNYGRQITSPGGSIKRIADGKPRELAATFDTLFTQADIARPVRVLTAKGDAAAWPVESRTAVVGGKRIVYIVGLNATATDIRLSAETPFSGWEDLITGERGTGTPFTVKPMDVKLLRLE